MTMREEAIRLAELGIRVIPIKPGQKYPPMAQWQNKASNDIHVVNDWFTSQYSGNRYSDNWYWWTTPVLLL
jgi:hypothetical protein